MHIGLAPRPRRMVLANELSALAPGTNVRCAIALAQDPLPGTPETRFRLGPPFRPDDVRAVDPNLRQVIVVAIAEEIDVSAGRPRLGRRLLIVMDATFQVPEIVALRLTVHQSPLPRAGTIQGGRPPSDKAPQLVKVRFLN